ncbi:MAG: hypothetical protein JXA78_13970 [Anaerolineales bacterium]|nr:hypothetical protein [Anaerolineales bacterium]
MSKKSKRQSRRNSTPVAEINGMEAGRRTAEAGFSPDYSQTIKDLKRIGVLASTFFMVLIVLSFFLR